MKKLIEKTSDKLVKAFLKNKIIAPIPSKFTKKIKEAQKLRKICESKIKLPVIGFKAAGTGIPLIKNNSVDYYIDTADKSTAVCACHCAHLFEI